MYSREPLITVQDTAIVERMYRVYEQQIVYYLIKNQDEIDSSIKLYTTVMGRFNHHSNVKYRFYDRSSNISVFEYLWAFTCHKMLFKYHRKIVQELVEALVNISDRRVVFVSEPNYYHLFPVDTKFNYLFSHDMDAFDALSSLAAILIRFLVLMNQTLSPVSNSVQDSATARVLPLLTKVFTELSIYDRPEEWFQLPGTVSGFTACFIGNIELQDKQAVLFHERFLEVMEIVIKELSYFHPTSLEKSDKIATPVIQYV